jgi:hypothetical protein
MAMATADARGRDYNENRELDEPTLTSAVPSEGTHTTQPERGLEPGNPNLVGAKPAAEKQGVADKVKGLLGGVMKGHHNKTGSPVGSGVGHTPESASEYTGHSLDPTAAPVGNNFSQEGDKKTISGSPGPWPHPTNPRAPTGHTDAHGGATLSDEHGNLHPGPKADSVKKEGFLSKIMDKLHSPRSPKSQH